MSSKSNKAAFSHWQLTYKRNKRLILMLQYWTQQAQRVTQAKMREEVREYLFFPAVGVQLLDW